MNKTIDLGITYNYNKYKANFIIMSIIKIKEKGVGRKRRSLGKGGENDIRERRLLKGDLHNQRRS